MSFPSEAYTPYTSVPLGMMSVALSCLVTGGGVVEQSCFADGRHWGARMVMVGVYPVEIYQRVVTLKYIYIYI